MGFFGEDRLDSTGYERFKERFKILELLFGWKDSFGRWMTFGVAVVVMMIGWSVTLHQTHHRTVTVCVVTTAGKEYRANTATDGTFEISNIHWFTHFDIHPADRYGEFVTGGLPGTYRLTYSGHRWVNGYPNILAAKRVQDDTEALAICSRSQALALPHFGNMVVRASARTTSTTF